MTLAMQAEKHQNIQSLKNLQQNLVTDVWGQKQSNAKTMAH